MKKIIVSAIAALLLLALTACSGNNSATEEAAAATEAPTRAPYLDTQLNEPEWTLAEGDLQLEDDAKLYAEKEDFLYFAIVTNTDGTQELRFKLNDETAAMLKTQSPDAAYYITLNGEKIGDATLSEDCAIAIVTAQNAAGEITSIATKIRGLSE